MLLLVVQSVFSLSGILSLGEKFHHSWMKLTCLFPRFLLLPLGIFILLNRSVRLESFKIMERMFQFLLFLSQCRRLFLMRMFRASSLMLLCLKFSWMNSRQFFEHNADILTTRPGVFSGNLMLEIPLTSDVPIRRKMYNLPFSSKEVVEKEIQVMLDLEIIEPSKSPYSSPVVLVRKRMGLAGFVLIFVVSTRSPFLMLNLFQMLRISLSGWHIHGFSPRLILPRGIGRF